MSYGSMLIGGIITYVLRAKWIILFSQQVVQTGVLNSPYGATAAAAMSPTVPASAFASLSNGINNSATAQMLMTPSGQVFPSLTSTFADNVTNFKVALPNDQNCSNNLVINTSPTLIKDDISAIQMTPLASFAPTQTTLPVNGTSKIEPQEESTFLNSESNGDSVTSLSPEVIIDSIKFSS